MSFTQAPAYSSAVAAGGGADRDLALLLSDLRTLGRELVHDPRPARSPLWWFGLRADANEARPFFRRPDGETLPPDHALRFTLARPLPRSRGTTPPLDPARVFASEDPVSTVVVEVTPCAVLVARAADGVGGIVVRRIGGPPLPEPLHPVEQRAEPAGGRFAFRAFPPAATSSSAPAPLPSKWCSIRAKYANCHVDSTP